MIPTEEIKKVNISNKETKTLIDTRTFLETKTQKNEKEAIQRKPEEIHKVL